MATHFGQFSKGLWEENPTFRLLLGMCPTLAVTGFAINGFLMGVATTFVLVCSALLISIFRNYVPSKVRIPIFIVVTATFVTLVDYVLAAYLPEQHKVLGIYIPLIVVNCLILGRLEAFSSKNGLSLALVDALGSGTGFTLGLTALAAIREFVGSGTLFYKPVLGDIYPGVGIMSLPAGAFISLGLLIGAINYYTQMKAEHKCKSCGGECSEC